MNRKEQKYKKVVKWKWEYNWLGYVWVVSADILGVVVIFGLIIEPIVTAIILMIIFLIILNLLFLPIRKVYFKKIK